jgi:tetratricopeptide (TPR) repeat protein
VIYSNYANLLHDVGRLAEALAFAERGLALDPLSRSKRRQVAYLMALNGRHEEARDIVERMAPVWPDDTALWRARLRLALWGGRYDAAIGLIDDPASGARSNAARTCWRLAAQVQRASAASAQSAARVRECHAAGHFPDSDALRLLVTLGDLDGGFALFEAPLAGADPLSGLAEGLFAPDNAAMRADPRFMPLMRDLGVLQYWRLSGRWPDFCREPRLPYRCEAEAMRLT